MPPDHAQTLLQAEWQRIAVMLERERDRILSEIRSYPPPIPACDAQFNHLLAQRQSISDELKQLHVVRTDSVEAICEFVRSSRHLDQQTKQRIAGVVEQLTSGS